MSLPLGNSWVVNTLWCVQPGVRGQNTGDRKLSQQVWVRRKQSLGTSGILWSPAAVKTVSLGLLFPLTFDLCVCLFSYVGQTDRVLGNPRQRTEKDTSDSSEGSFCLLCFGSRCPLPQARVRVGNWTPWREAGLETKANIYPSESALSYAVVLALVCPFKL